jgi:hypothetical protein
VGTKEEAYHTSLAQYVQHDNRPNCEKWVVGVMGDNRYPQTVGASGAARLKMCFHTFPSPRV